MTVMLDQKSCEMQLDTGAIVSILPKTLYDQQFNHAVFTLGIFTTVKEFTYLDKFLVNVNIN